MNKVRNKILITSLASLVVLVAVIYFVIVPLVSQVGNLNLQINQKLALLFPADQVQIVNPTKQYNLVAEELQKKSILLKEEDALSFIDLLESLANNNQLEQDISIANVPAVAGEDKIQTIVLELSLKGKLKNTVNYLTELEKLDTYINFEQFSIYRAVSSTAPSLPGETSETNQQEITIQIEANTYWN